MNAREEKKGLGSRILAKLLSPEEANKYNPNIPKDWFNTPSAIQEQLAKGGGLAYVATPFASYYDKIFGALQSPDLSKFRQIYRQVPEARRAIDIKIQMAILGWNLRMPDEVDKSKGDPVIKYLKDWLNKIAFYETLRKQCYDNLDLGFSFTEIVFDAPDETTAETVVREKEYQDAPKIPSTFDPVNKLQPKQAQEFHTTGIKASVHSAPSRKSTQEVRELLVAQSTPENSVAPIPVGIPVNLKVVDGLFVRVRRDAVGNTYGFIQWLSWPPLVFDTSKMVMMIHNATSWAYENAYGISDYLSLIETQDKIWHIEADLMIVSHTNVAPMLHAKCGTPERPYTDTQRNKVKTEMSNRGPAANVVTNHDVEINPLQISTSLSGVLDFYKRLVEQRRIILGVPAGLLGAEMPGSYAKEAADVSTFKGQLKCIQEELINSYHDNIFPAILEPIFGKGCPIPYLTFESPFEEDLNTKAARIREDYKIGLITKGMALEESGYQFDPTDDTLDEYYQAPAPVSPFGAPSPFDKGNVPKDQNNQDENAQNQKDNSKAPPKKQTMAPYKARFSENLKALVALLSEDEEEQTNPMQAYSDEQERDNDGKWTDMGGGGSGAKPADNEVGKVAKPSERKALERRGKEVTKELSPHGIDTSTPEGWKDVSSRLEPIKDKMNGAWSPTRFSVDTVDDRNEVVWEEKCYSRNQKDIKIKSGTEIDRERKQLVADTLGYKLKTRLVILNGKPEVYEMDGFRGTRPNNMTRVK